MAEDPERLGVAEEVVKAAQKYLAVEEAYNHLVGSDYRNKAISRKELEDAIAKYEALL